MGRIRTRRFAGWFDSPFDLLAVRPAKKYKRAGLSNSLDPAASIGDEVTAATAGDAFAGEIERRRHE